MFSSGFEHVTIYLIAVQYSSGQMTHILLHISCLFTMHSVRVTSNSIFEEAPRSTNRLR